MEEAHKAVLKRKRVHGDKIVPVPEEIRDHNRSNEGGSCYGMTTF